MRHLIRLVESMQSHVTPALVDEFIEHVRGNGYDSIKMHARMEAGLDPYGDEPDPENLDEIIRDWCQAKLYDVEGDIKWGLFRDGKIRAWREITATEDWTPQTWKHPGIYWSYEKDAAEAHWGDPVHHEAGGPVTFLMEALLTYEQVDWPRTLIQNANPDYEWEKEIRILPNTPVEIVSCQRIERRR